MQEGPGIRWSVHALGYAASLGLLVAVGYAIYGRLQKIEAHLRHSHESDWIFLLLLLAVTVTGILQHVLHRTGTDLAANVAYVVHLALVVPMLTLEVPFSKWSHLVYRPLAMYLAQIHRVALERQSARASHADVWKMASE
jgi:nitrate reductase gamma subunit